jgi:outer membrane receptor protein involved in Fe transport/5-hydroxyisourate hydrolase-like protein (transthyretin family)
MIRILLAGIMMLSLLTAQAQNENRSKTKGTISGTIIDSLSGRPVEYATITLFHQGTKRIVSGAVTDQQGRFTISELKNGSYRILVESIGYQSHSVNNLKIDDQSSEVELKEITLSVKNETLQNVIINTPNRLVENKIDKLVFNAEKDMTSQGGVATDVLKKVPMVSVDVDGNVELAGSSSIRFLINGKPSAVFGSSITDVLQSIPSSQIKSIEVITNPGAKYDAEGLGGIINIILKDSKVKGINGNISLTAGTKNENGSFNFNARKGDIGFHAFIGGNERLNANGPSSSDRLTIDTAAKTNISLLQDGNFRFKRHGLESGVGFDWTYKKKNDFTGSVRYGRFGNSGTGFTNQSQVTTDQITSNIISSIVSANYSGNSSYTDNIDASLNYKRSFSKEDEELEIGLNTSRDNNHGTANNYQVLLPQDSTFYGTSSTNPGKESETEITIDYSNPIKKDIVFGTGGKIVSSRITSDADISLFQPDKKEYFYNSSLSNDLDYKQKVYALYSEISFPVGKLFNTKIGGRYERTEINSFYSNAQQQAPKYGYNTFVPSIFFSKNLNDNETIKLSYSKRIERPDYRDLNPFVNTTDPKNISTGNPFLNPEIGHRFELSYNRNFQNAGSFMVSAFYRINDHDIQPFIIFYPSLQVGDSVYTNVAVSTRQNIGMEKNWGMNFFVDIHFTDKFSVRSNFFFFYRHTLNALDPGYNSYSFNYRLNMNASYQFGKNFAGELFGFFNSPRNQAQGKYPSFTYYSMALRKQFWNKKASLAFTVSNPFSEYLTQRTKLFGPNFTINGVRQIAFRSFGINFTWKFGKLEFKKDNENNQDNGNSNNMPEG